MTVFIRALMICMGLWMGQAYAEDTPDFIDHDEILMDHGGGHMMDFGGGMVMGQNTNILPQSCISINDEIEIDVYAGRKYAEKFPGRMFAFDKQEWRVRPCTRITWHFFNEDNVRHQFMMHGLPKYIYKSGMFHLEVTGPGKISGTMIVPANDQTYLVHCDISQHMEKGMKAQLVVGKGGTSLPSIPGLTPFAFPDSYEMGGGSARSTGTIPAGNNSAAKSPALAVREAESTATGSLISGILVIGVAFGLLATPILSRKFKGMSRDQILCYLGGQLNCFFQLIMKWLTSLVGFVMLQVKKVTSKS